MKQKRIFEENWNTMIISAEPSPHPQTIDRKTAYPETTLRPPGTSVYPETHPSLSLQIGFHGNREIPTIW